MNVPNFKTKMRYLVVGLSQINKILHVNRTHSLVISLHILKVHFFQYSQESAAATAWFTTRQTRRHQVRPKVCCPTQLRLDYRD